MPKLHPLSTGEKYLLSAQVPRGLFGGNAPVSPRSVETLPLHLYIKGGRLVHLECLPDEKKLPASCGWREVCLSSNLLLVPAYVDCHVHLALDGINGFNGFQQPGSPEAILQRLVRTARAGVLAVRDGSDRFNSALSALRSIISWPAQQPLPAVIATGTAIFRQGCYGSFLSNTGITSIEEVYNKVEQLANQGAEQVKVVLSGLVSFQKKGEVNGPLQFSLQEMKEIVRAASRFELPVMVHASSDRAARLAAEAGVHSIEHGYFLSPATLELMLDRNVAWIPTLAPLFAVLEKEGKSNRPALNMEALTYAIEKQLEMVALAHHKGVTLGLGTDAGSPGVGWNNGYALEMNLFSRAGIPPVDLLKIASQNGSRILGLSSETGGFEVGLKPNFICLDRRYLVKPEKYSNPEAIFFPAQARSITCKKPAAEPGAST